MVIYKATNKVNGKVYIGQTRQELSVRIRQHCTGNSKVSFIHSALKKYGKENFEWTIIDRDNDIQQLNIKEEFWITFFKCLAPRGYNLKTGGNAWSLTNIAKQHMSVAAKKKNGIGRN